VLGGLKIFGFAGILIGPLVFTMALTFVLIYQEAYGPGKESTPSSISADNDRD
jgi:predicted PurR-regulated permease PerM